MLFLHANTRALTWHREGGGGSFVPSGKRTYFGDRAVLDYRRNPVRWDSTETHAARLIVGFNVGGEPRWSVEDVIPIVAAVRKDQGDKQGATFLYQKGLYRHHVSGQLVEENGAQVVIIDVWGTPREAFHTEMMTLAETLAARLEQEEVILEFQVNGVTTSTLGVYA
jgi:hypothetical protein